MKRAKTSRHKPLQVDGRFRYLEYKDRYQGIIKKRRRIGLHSDHTIKKLILHPDKVDKDRRCLAWPFCDTEVVDNNFNITCNAHWYILPKKFRKELTSALSRYPVKSRIRKAIIKKAAQRLQLAGKRGQVMRDHLSDYMVRGEKEDQL